MRPLTPGSAAADGLSPPLGIPQASPPTPRLAEPEWRALGPCSPLASLSALRIHNNFQPAPSLSPSAARREQPVPSTRLHFKVCPLYLQRIKKGVIRTSWPTEAALIPAQAAFRDPQTLSRKHKRERKVALRRQETFSSVKASVRGPGRTSPASFGQESRPWGEGPGKTLKTQSPGLRGPS